MVIKTEAGQGDAEDAGGQPVEALYDYAASLETPFLPDTRKELTMKRGDVFYLIHKRPEDGWCLVCTSSNGKGTEGWVRLPTLSCLSCVFAIVATIPEIQL